MARTPSTFQQIRTNYRAVADCYERLAEVCHELGPLPARSRALVKLGMAIGSGHEGAVHAHTRMALEAGWAPAALRHVAILATTTLGFPSMVRAHAWVEDVLEGDGRAAAARPRRVGKPAPKRRKAPVKKAAAKPTRAKKRR